MTPTLFRGGAIIMTLRRGFFWPNRSQGQCIVEDRAPQPCVIVLLTRISDRSHSYNPDACLQISVPSRYIKLKGCLGRVYLEGRLRMLLASNAFTSPSPVLDEAPRADCAVTCLSLRDRAMRSLSQEAVWLATCCNWQG